MICGVDLKRFADGFEMDNLDRQIADRYESDKERNRLVSITLSVNHDELTGELNRDSWFVHHGDAVKQNVLQLLSGERYHIRLWLFGSRETTEALGRLHS